MCQCWTMCKSDLLSWHTCLQVVNGKQKVARKFWVSHNFVPTSWHLVATTLEMELWFFFSLNIQNLKQSSNPAGLPKSMTSMLIGIPFSSVHVPLLPQGWYPVVTVPAGSAASRACLGVPVWIPGQWEFKPTKSSHYLYIWQSGELQSNFCTNKLILKPQLELVMYLVN